MIEINETTGFDLIIITVVVCFTIIVSIYRLTAYGENIERIKNKTNIEEVSK